MGPRASLDRFWWTENPLLPPDIEPWTVQPTQHCYMDYTITAPGDHQLISGLHYVIVIVFIYKLIILHCYQHKLSLQ
jgi:hypothetical protein